MNDKNILRFKLGLATISILFLLTGAKLLFNQWTSIPISFWLLTGVITYGTVYRTFKSISNKNNQIIFHDFEIAGTVTFLVVIGLATIMVLIFYPLIALLFFGLGLMTLSVFGGLKFITFDFNKNIVDGLFENRDSNLSGMTVDVNFDKNQIEIRTPDRDDNLILKKEMYGDKVWTQLVDSFQKIKVRT
jgi:hypothetical protein